jgi:uncharacterized protein
MTKPSEDAPLPPKKSKLKALAAKIIDIARQKDTPHKIALGLALGIFVGILPIMGIQMTVVALLALPLRANIKAALAGVWISNPITFIPMYWGYYKLGVLFFPSRFVSWDAFIGRVTQTGGISWSSLGKSLARLLDLGVDILIPMWTGATILAVAFSIPTYFITKKTVTAYRARSKKQPKIAEK